jgi:hypothetical protein
MKEINGENDKQNEAEKKKNKSDQKDDWDKIYDETGNSILDKLEKVSFSFRYKK